MNGFKVQRLFHRKITDLNIEANIDFCNSKISAA